MTCTSGERGAGMSALDIHIGDCLEVTSGFNAGSFDLIYIDPPFYTGRTQSRKQPLIKSKIEEDMWTILPQPKLPFGLDTAPFPDKLVKRRLEIVCLDDGVVLDPFLGSGTTARVANWAERSTIDIDLNCEFCQYAVKTLRDAKSCS